MPPNNHHSDDASAQIAQNTEEIKRLSGQFTDMALTLSGNKNEPGIFEILRGIQAEQKVIRDRCDEAIRRCDQRDEARGKLETRITVLESEKSGLWKVLPIVISIGSLLLAAGMFILKAI